MGVVYRVGLESGSSVRTHSTAVVVGVGVSVRVVVGVGVSVRVVVGVRVSVRVSVRG